MDAATRANRSTSDNEVYARARLVWGGDAPGMWLESPNVFLGGARPLDVLLTDGPTRVLEALEAEMWGGAA